MTIYTYQPQSLIDKINEQGYALVDFAETNLYKQTQDEHGQQYHEAYIWMARKLGEKTGIWMKHLYGDDLDAERDADGDYIDEDGQKIPVLPFWGWYITDGENSKPDETYCFDQGENSNGMDWNVNIGETRLVTLDVPERLVLLSDANAWYCALEGKPCYEYESPEVEAQKVNDFYDRYDAFLEMPDSPEKMAAGEELWREIHDSWDNIFRLEGRRLKSFMGEDEKYDIQAVFPIIVKDWIVSVEEV